MKFSAVILFVASVAAVALDTEVPPALSQPGRRGVDCGACDRLNFCPGKPNNNVELNRISSYKRLTSPQYALGSQVSKYGIQAAQFFFTMTRRTPVTANLDGLPPEILEQIIFSVTDLRSIYHIVAASPAASRVFESSQVGPKALDNVSSVSMSPDVVQLIRLVSLVRASTSEYLSAPSLQDFVERYTKCQGRSDSSVSSVAPDLATSLRLQSPHLVRGILLTARRICCLTWACLEYYRSQWPSVTPAHLESPFRWGVGYEKPWRQNPRGTLYEPQPIGPACWMEEQRVMRGFWRVQLLFETANEKLLLTFFSKAGPGRGRSSLPLWTLSITSKAASFFPQTLGASQSLLRATVLRRSGKTQFCQE
ncbi:hypothetical protein CSAL01_09147 [Colletotrichum salicis]|uniref:F-box domain-containing protein n=1 Tax=Colletotrichum salicis TaxID=1209931 RepID=A0A135UG33_9PEZI|nr:hypothetical protein CSAL01_09147 [Colletotrichum salicis]